MEDYFIIQNKGLRSPQIASLAISPDDPSVIYAGTGDQGGSELAGDLEWFEVQ